MPSLSRRQMLLASAAAALSSSRGRAEVDTVDASSLRHKVMCGYQGWFRCPGDAAGMGWIHYSRASDRIAPDTLTFELWPDVSELAADERFAAPGFTRPDGRAAELFSSDHPATVRRHFDWMRAAGIDGAWLQHFLVDLPDQPNASRYGSRRRVMDHVATAARATGRAWAVSFDIAGLATGRIFAALTSEWRRLVDAGLTTEGRYLREGGLPVVQIWGFYHQNQGNAMTAELANALIDFFAQPGPYRAFLAGGGDWNWRRNPDPEWQRFYRRFGAYSPWNVGHAPRDPDGIQRAATYYWADDLAECERVGMLWLPVVYPGFSWDNLQRLPVGQSCVPRRRGAFLWEQFRRLSELRVDTAYVAMFDEMDEGTAIFKVTSEPPTQAHFVGYEGLPSDAYLRLVGEAGRLLRAGQPWPDQWSGSKG